MRASRLLRMLMLLQNRGRMTSGQLADELEVAPRTILRDVDALTEAGLPIITHQGSRGGIELGFGYRSRLTGLASDEAEALAVILAAPIPELHELGLAEAGERARIKMLESFPEIIRETMAAARRRVSISTAGGEQPDPRIAALAEAIGPTGAGRDPLALGRAANHPSGDAGKARASLVGERCARSGSPDPTRRMRRHRHFGPTLLARRSVRMLEQLRPCEALMAWPPSITMACTTTWCGECCRPKTALRKSCMRTPQDGKSKRSHALTAWHISNYARDRFPVTRC